jgi:hypothetical protein
MGRLLPSSSSTPETDDAFPSCGPLLRKGERNYLRPAAARQGFPNLVGNSGSMVFPVLTLRTMAAAR